MKRICLLLLLCLPLIFTGNNANADLDALAAIPNPVAKVAVLPGHHAELTVTLNSANKPVAKQNAGVFLEVDAAVVAKGYGQVAMITYGDLYKGDKVVETLSERQTIEKIGVNLGLVQLDALELVRCDAYGQYIKERVFLLQHHLAQR